MLFRFHWGRLYGNVVLAKAFLTVAKRSKEFCLPKWLDCDIMSVTVIFLSFLPFIYFLFNREREKISVFFATCTCFSFQHGPEKKRDTIIFRHCYVWVTDKCYITQATWVRYDRMSDRRHLSCSLIKRCKFLVIL